MKGHRQHQATKHISPKFHMTGYQVEKGNIRIEHMPTEWMVADILTKALHRESFVRLRDILLADP